MKSTGTESKLMVKAIESVIKTRNLGYGEAKCDLGIQITKEETENYIYITLNGYEATYVAYQLKSIFGAVYSLQATSNDNVTISIFKKS